MMKFDTSDPTRTDTLLALAFAFTSDAAIEARVFDNSTIENSIVPLPAEHVEGREDDALAIFASLPGGERAMLAEQATRLVALPIAEREVWIESVLRRNASELTQLDEHVHPSHVFAKLSDEPSHVRRIVLAHLPDALAATIAATFGESHGTDSLTTLRRLAPEVAEVVNRTFLEGFVPFRTLPAPTALDQLSGVELRRLIRSLGVRETAIACRGIEAAETVASFLRRFGAEDARAVASHLASLTDIDAARVRQAEITIRRSLESEGDMNAMLYRTGLRVLAAAADWRDERRLDYTLQKLHVEAADELRELVRASGEPDARRSDTNIEVEVERLAATIHGAETEAGKPIETIRASAARMNRSSP